MAQRPHRADDCRPGVRLTAAWVRGRQCRAPARRSGGARVPVYKGAVLKTHGSLESTKCYGQA